VGLFSALKQWVRVKPAINKEWADTTLSALPLLAIDLELTSLNAKVAKVTSVGWVSGKGSTIHLDTAYYQIVRAAGSLAQSPVIHGLTAETIESGAHVKDAMKELAAYASTHVWVFHNASLDTAVLNRVLTELGMLMPDILTVDTLKLALYMLQKEGQVAAPNSATLAVCRQKLGLPAAPQHNSLDDAMATLQLLQAQMHDLGATNQTCFSDLFHTHAVAQINLGKSVNR